MLPLILSARWSDTIERVCLRSVCRYLAVELLPADVAEKIAFLRAKYVVTIPSYSYIHVLCNTHANRRTRVGYTQRSGEQGPRDSSSDNPLGGIFAGCGFSADAPLPLYAS